MDIIVTWPKKRALDSYLEGLKQAVEQGLNINFRVARKPKGNLERCYMVHDGAIRGYNLIVEIAYRSEHDIEAIVDDEHWPTGWYIVRDPEWHKIDPVPMKGFRGFRYLEERP